jgi:hypothetical protein
MPASIDVGVELAAEVDQKTFLVGTANRQHELQRLARRERVGARDFVACVRGRVFASRMRSGECGAASMLVGHFMLANLARGILAAVCQSP